MNPFEYVNSINYSKKDIMVDDIAEKGYNSFMVNRSLSYFQDTVLMANEMNKNHQIDKRLQFDFLINIVRKRKRFSKWFKNTVEKDVAKYCGIDVTSEYLTQEQEEQLAEDIEEDNLL